MCGRHYQQCFSAALRPTVAVLLLFTQTFSIMKTLRCRDAGFDCEKEIHGPTEDAVLQQAAQHALQVHNVKVTPELAAQIKRLIKEEGAKRQ